MRSSSQARSAAKSAPFTPRGVSICAASVRRSRIDIQRDGKGADNRRIRTSATRPSAPAKTSAPNAPSRGPAGPTTASERRAEAGSSYSASVAGSITGVGVGDGVGTGPGTGVASESSNAPTALAGVGRGVGEVAGTGAAAPLGAGRGVARGFAGAGDWPNPGGNSDSGRSCAAASAAAPAIRSATALGRWRKARPRLLQVAKRDRLFDLGRRPLARPAGQEEKPSDDDDKQDDK